MAGFPEELLPSWSHLTRLGAHLQGGDSISVPYLFRGQSDYGWCLTPTLHRATSRDEERPIPTAERLVEIEQFLTDKFRALAPIHLNSAVLKYANCNLDWWLVMRHYGVPTRILDWTESIYVAAYFAAHTNPKKDGAIYLLHTASFRGAMRNTFAEMAAHSGYGPQCDDELAQIDAPPVIYAASKRHAHMDRVVAQQGVFMYGRNVRTDFETVLPEEMGKVADPNKYILRKLRIPAALKPTMVRNLRAMNVTGGSLFLGLDGIGRHLEDIARTVE